MPENIASPVRRIGAFVIDQIAIGFITIIVGVIIFSTQQNALNTITDAVMKFGEQNQNASGDNELQQRFSDAVVNNGDVQSAFASLLIPFVVWIAASLLVAAIYYIGLTLRSGQTLGKKLLKIRVINKDGNIPNLLQSTERYFLYVGLSSLSSILGIIELLVYRTLEVPNESLSLLHTALDITVFVLFFVGALMIVTRPDKRGYHDISASTYVVKQTT